MRFKFSNKNLEGNLYDKYIKKPNKAICHVFLNILTINCANQAPPK